MSGHQLNNLAGSALSAGLDRNANQCRPEPNEVGAAMDRIREQLNLLQDSVQQVRIRIEPVCEIQNKVGIENTGQLVPVPLRRSQLGTSLYQFADELEGLNVQLLMLLQNIAL
jgi:hypothetical protein